MGRLDSIAKRLGFSTQQASGQLAQYLPIVVDPLTPAGKLPPGDALSDTLGAMLSGLGQKP